MKILLENELKNLLHIIDKCSIADVNTGLQHLYKELFSKVDIYIYTRLKCLLKHVFTKIMSG